MTRTTQGPGPLDFLIGGSSLALGAGVLSEMGYGLASFIVGMLSAVALLIGGVAQGVRLGMREAEKDRALDTR